MHEICNALCYISKECTRTTHKSSEKKRESERKTEKKKFSFHHTMNSKINQNDDDALVCAVSIQITLRAQIYTIAILENDIYSSTKKILFVQVD